MSGSIWTGTSIDLIGPASILRNKLTCMSVRHRATLPGFPGQPIGQKALALYVLLIVYGLPENTFPRHDLVLTRSLRQSFYDRSACTVAFKQVDYRIRQGVLRPRLSRSKAV